MKESSALQFVNYVYKNMTLHEYPQSICNISYEMTL